jgi:IS30 family transposase
MPLLNNRAGKCLGFETPAEVFPYLDNSPAGKKVAKM